MVHRGHMVYLVPVASLALLEDMDRLATQDLKVEIEGRVSIHLHLMYVRLRVSEPILLVFLRKERAKGSKRRSW